MVGTLSSGRVVSMTPSSVTVRLPDGSTVTAKNGLHVRLPVNATVLVADTDKGQRVVSRDR